MMKNLTSILKSAVARDAGPGGRGEAQRVSVTQIRNTEPSHEQTQYVRTD